MCDVIVALEIFGLSDVALPGEFCESGGLIPMEVCGSAHPVSADALAVSLEG